MNLESRSVPEKENNRENRSESIKRVDWIVAIFLFLVVVLQGLHTIDAVGVSWDEPNYYDITKQYLNWAARIGDGDSFDPQTLEKTFGLKPKKNDHPTLTKIISATTCALFKNSLGGFRAYRLSAPLLFGILVAIIYISRTRAWGRTAGIASAFFVAVIPRFFAHNHIAATDAPLCLFWLVAVLAFEQATRKRSMIAPAAIACGLVMSVKFTGFLVFIPIAAWAVLYRRKKMWPPLVAVVLVAPLVFLALQPAMWNDPAGDIVEFIRMSVTRAKWNPRWMVFLGRVHNFSPPWYYAPFMVLVTLPEVILGMFIVGLGHFTYKKCADPVIGLCAINFIFFLAITVPPSAPVFDGVRLFLPSFMFAGIIAGYGLDRTIKWILKKVEDGKLFSGAISPRSAAAIVAAVVFIGSASPLMGIYPYGLEYYNGLIGGVDGARETGMETSYWWTALNGSSLKKIDKTLPPNASLRFAPMDRYMWKLYIEEGMLGKDREISSGTDFDYILVLSRPYWNYENLFRYIGVPHRMLAPVDSLIVDGVPFWILYRRI